jgi:hypothetical protein
MAEPAAQPLTPPRQRKSLIALWDALAVLTLVGLPIGCLHMAGAL